MNQTTRGLSKIFEKIILNEFLLSIQWNINNEMLNAISLSLLKTFQYFKMLPRKFQMFLKVQHECPPPPSLDAFFQFKQNVEIIKKLTTTNNVYFRSLLSSSVHSSIALQYFGFYFSNWR